MYYSTFWIIMLKYYNSITLSNGVVLSCDMVRVTFAMSPSDISGMFAFINSMMLSHDWYDYTNYTSLKLFNYRELITVRHKESDSSFTVGLGFNGVCKKDISQCFIEFNPNKTLSNGYVTPFLDYIKSHAKFVDIKRYDVAFDIPIDRQYVWIGKDKRHYIMYRCDILAKDLANFTEYLGKRNTNGFVKLYNKQLESGLHSPLTRLEITSDNFNYNDFVSHLPKLYFVKQQNLVDINLLNDTERVLYMLLMQSDMQVHWYNKLGRKMRDKLKDILFEQNSISIDENIYYQFVRGIKHIIV